MTTRTPRKAAPDRGGRRSASAILCLALVLAACSAESQAGDERTVEDFHSIEFDPANFVDPTTSTNRWHPLRPGTQWVKHGTTEVGQRAVPHQVISTMTDVIRVIDGVPAIAMLDEDIDSGELAQVAVDYFALDKDGNVWLVGGYTEEYSGGEFTNTADAWLGSGGGVRLGVLMPSEPTPETQPWLITGEPDGEGGKAAEVVETGQRQCAEFACYEDVLVIREGEIGELDNEFKFYAPDVGQILNSPRRDSRHKDTETLVNLTQLTEAGLTEMSDRVLALEEHAREVEPEVFGTTQPSTRAP